MSGEMMFLPSAEPARKACRPVRKTPMIPLPQHPCLLSQLTCQQLNRHCPLLWLFTTDKIIYSMQDNFHSSHCSDICCLAFGVISLDLHSLAIHKSRFLKSKKVTIKSVADQNFTLWSYKTVWSAPLPQEQAWKLVALIIKFQYYHDCLQFQCVMVRSLHPDPMRTRHWPSNNLEERFWPLTLTTQFHAGKNQDCSYGPITEKLWASSHLSYPRKYCPHLAHAKAGLI